MAEWFVAQNNEKFGPFTTPQLKQLARAGKITPEDMLWREEFPGWVKASEATGLFVAPQQQAPVQPPPVQQQPFQQQVPQDFQQQQMPVSPQDMAGETYGIEQPPPAPKPQMGPSVDAIPENLRVQVGIPYCTASIMVANAVIKGEFDIQLVLDAFVANIARALKGKFNVRIGHPSAGIPSMTASVIQIDAETGKTLVEIEGEVVGPGGVSQAYMFTHKGSKGLFGSTIEATLAKSAANIAKRVASLMLKS